MSTVAVLGANGYIGWPLCWHLLEAGHDVVAVDGLQKVRWEALTNSEPHNSEVMLPWHARCARLREIYEERFQSATLDLVRQSGALYSLFDERQPDALVHLAEMPSAPYSMMTRGTAVETLINNEVSTINVLFGSLHSKKRPHIIKLGTMGEYGTPNIPILEGWLNVEVDGRPDRVVYPKRPGSFYHASKVADSTYLEFAVRNWPDLRVTDINQGPVYGIVTGELAKATAFHTDAIFGTVINRFIAQAVEKVPLTVYGKGGQTRGYIHLSDTLRCIQHAIENPPKQGEFRVWNQIAEVMTVNEIADRVCAAVPGATVKHIKNPRTEAEEHFYEVKSSLQGTLASRSLTLGAILEMVEYLREVRPPHKQTWRNITMPRVKWRDR